MHFFSWSILFLVANLPLNKIANFNSEAYNNQKIAQVVDYSGIFKPMMINFINQFIK